MRAYYTRVPQVIINISLARALYTSARQRQQGRRRRESTRLRCRSPLYSSCSSREILSFIISAERRSVSSPKRDFDGRPPAGRHADAPTRPFPDGGLLPLAFSAHFSGRRQPSMPAHVAAFFMARYCRAAGRARPRGFRRQHAHAHRKEAAMTARRARYMRHCHDCSLRLPR